MTETATHQDLSRRRRPRDVVVPDKPALEGLEATWASAGRRTTPTPSTAPSRARTSTRSTPRRRRCSGSLHVGHVFSYTHTDLDRALPADARQVGVLPDGLGRQRPAHRAPGAELLRRALRPVAAVRPRLHPAGEARPQAAGPDQAPQLRRALRGARPARTSRCSRQLWRTLGLSVDWAQHYTTIGPGPRVSQRAFLRNFARGEAYLQERRRCGTSPSRPPSPRPSSRPASTPAPTTGSPTTGATEAGRHRDHPPRADPGGRRADRAPRRRALPAAVRQTVPSRCSTSRSRCSRTRWPRWTRAPASRCAARSATSPTSSGGASWSCRSAR